MIFAVNAIFAEDGNTDEYCLDWESGSCQMCVLSYLRLGKCIPPLNKIKNCLQYSSETECLNCKLGYYPINDNKKCDKIPQNNCLSVDDNFNCYSCANGIKINYYSCADESIKCRIENCEICVENQGYEFCSICKEGYVVYRGPHILSKCVREDDKTKGCWMFEYDSHKCANCKVNYYFVDGKCVRSTKYTDSLYGSTTIINTILIIIMVLLLN